jgi:MerR family transcriptional regulator, copper efflux regulator
MQTMKIGEVAKRSGVGIETIRFYEREGLLQEPQRRPSGYRQYDVSTVQRLEYIRRAKELGFTLAEIRELLELSFAAQRGCDHIRQRAEAKITDIENKIHSLQKMRRSLRKIVDRCKTTDSPHDCPLVYGDHDTEAQSAG